MTLATRGLKAFSILLCLSGCLFLGYVTGRNVSRKNWSDAFMLEDYVTYTVAMLDYAVDDDVAAQKSLRRHLAFLERSEPRDPLPHVIGMEIAMAFTMLASVTSPDTQNEARLHLLQRAESYCQRSSATRCSPRDLLERLGRHELNNPWLKDQPELIDSNARTKENLPDSSKYSPELDR